MSRNRTLMNKNRFVDISIIVYLVKFLACSLFFLLYWLRKILLHTQISEVNQYERIIN